MNKIDPQQQVPVTSHVFVEFCANSLPLDYTKNYVAEVVLLVSSSINLNLSLGQFGCSLDDNQYLQI